MNYQKITPVDIANGIGVRVILWVSGCEHHCFNCHNPGTWDPNSGKEFTEHEMEELLKDLDKPFIDGITFSGGDPMATYNRKKVLEIAERIRRDFPEKTIWLYSGYTYEQLMKEETARRMLEVADVLVDGKFVQELYSIDLKWKGSENQRVIDLKKTAEYGTIVLFA